MSKCWRAWNFMLTISQKAPKEAFKCLRFFLYSFEYGIHTYIIGHYKPSVRIIDLVSHTTSVVYVNLIHKCRDLKFKVESERQIVGETFHGSFNLLSEFLPQIYWGEIAEEILFVFCFDVWPRPRILALRLTSQYTTY